MFHIGQKVVCVNDSRGRWTGRRELSKGSIYTVRGVDRTTPPWFGVFLEEIHLGQHPSPDFPNKELSFAIERFRPVAERKTDISVFTEMLTPSPRRVKKLVAITTSQRAGEKP